MTLYAGPADLYRPVYIYTTLHAPEVRLYFYIFGSALRKPFATTAVIN